MSRRTSQPAKGEQLPLIPDIALDSLKKTKGVRKDKSEPFLGTDNPRHLRVIHVLQTSPRTRESIDHIAGASNGPELISELRRRNLTIKCERVPAIDCDDRPVRIGVYSFDADDRKKVHFWRAGGGAQ